MSKLPIVLLSLALLAPLAQAQEAGDAAKGEKVFAQCKACHEVEKGVNKVAPPLKGVIGRPVASVPDYNYSQAMKDFAKTNPAWTDELFLTYIENPKKVVPGTKMAFAGLKKPEDRANILAYLKSRP